MPSLQGRYYVYGKLQK